MKLTIEQFDALASLMSLRNSPSAKAAKLHMVDDMRIVDAARNAGCTTRAVSNSVARVKAALQLAERAVK
jgi:DNA-directed RNA polymerase specialized sigma24 family protein